MKEKIKNILDKLPYIRTLKSVIKTYKTLYSPGHYHSCIPSKEEILKREKQIFEIRKKEISGVNLNEKEQFELLKEMKKYYDEIPFGDNKKDNLRYCFDNPFYCYSDAIFLYLVIRHFHPGRVVEVGSGFSSAVILDTDEWFLKNEVQCTFIEPNPERLFSIMKKEDKKNHRIIKSYVQDVDPKLFNQLVENDILFIDSSHVSKTGSDVNFVIFDILPSLNCGVLIHLHDVFYPFEYPKEWVLEGMAWNESYILRAFLQYNSQFKIVLFNTFLEYYYEYWFKENMPLCLKNRGGSIWLKRL